ncbi:MAG: sialidase family protein, partial [Pirellulales bacterium]
LLIAPQLVAIDVVPGTVVAHSPAKSDVYIGSPGIARLSDGTYLAKHDEFGPKSTEHESAVTRVYRSTNCGRSWKAISKVDGLFWSNIFEHGRAVYMIGTHHHHGALVVVKSTNGGEMWSTPKDSRSGLIRGGKYHTAPVPMLVENGRLWRAVEDCDGPAGWGQMYRPRVISIPSDGDLLDSDQWTITNPIKRDGRWLGGTFWCVLEGNVVVDRGGVIRNILRSNHDEIAAVTTVSADAKTQTVDPEFDRISLPGSSKKMLIRWDEPSQLYWALSNPPAPGSREKGTSETRNTLGLYNSSDLRKWTLRCILLHHPDRETHGFQYPDWVTDGDDLLVASRTAFDDSLGGAIRAHDANYLTFHRFKNFRRLTMADGVQVK